MVYLDQPWGDRAHASGSRVASILPPSLFHGYFTHDPIAQALGGQGQRLADIYWLNRPVHLILGCVSAVDALWWVLAYDTNTLTLCTHSYVSAHTALPQSASSPLFQTFSFQALNQPRAYDEKFWF